MPATPPAKPAPKSVPRLTGTATVYHDSTTATSTITATATPSCWAVNAATSATPGTVPTARAGRVQRIACQSMWRCSPSTESPEMNSPNHSGRAGISRRREQRDRRRRHQPHAEPGHGLDESADEDGEPDQEDRARRQPVQAQAEALRRLRRTYCMIPPLR